MYIKRLHIELGCTMVLVTHDQEDAMSLADRVAVMSDGLLNQIDTPRKIYDHPADLFVAGFIGDLPMNFLEGSVEREGGKTFVRYRGIRLELSTRAGSQELPPEVVVGVRPGHLRIQSSGENDGSLKAEVFVVEPLGDMNIVTIQMEDLRFQVLAPPNYRSASGVPVRILADSQQVLLFDGKTGRAIPTQ
jgi:multiple sugar transport system ATP-binding protein